MSIATSLQKVIDSKEAIKTSINNKGGQITSATPFSAYSAAIDNIPSGGGGDGILKSVSESDFTGTTFSAVTSYITAVIIPNGVTTIGNSAFSSLKLLSSVNIPEGVTSIPYGCFLGCSSLTSITIPDSVTSFGNYSFSGCSNMLSATLGSGITDITYDSFASCVSLLSFTIKAIVPPNLASSALSNTNNCPIYVPAESVEAYKGATNWRGYASRIQAIPT